MASPFPPYSFRGKKYKTVLGLIRACENGLADQGNDAAVECWFADGQFHVRHMSDARSTYKVAYLPDVIRIS